MSDTKIWTDNRIKRVRGQPLIVPGPRLSEVRTHFLNKSLSESRRCVFVNVEILKASFADSLMITGTTTCCFKREMAGVTRSVLEHNAVWVGKWPEHSNLKLHTQPSTAK